MKVFLTGGTGFIGKPLTRQLLARGWQVTALVRNPEGKQAQVLLQMGATLVKGDVTDKESLRAGMTGADVVVHNAGMYEVGVTRVQGECMRAVNVDGTEHVLSLAQELNIGRVVYVSTLAAYGETGPVERDENFARQSQKLASVYERTKTEAHKIARRYQAQGLPLIIVCPGFVIGANDHSSWGHFVRMYVNGFMPPTAWARNNIARHASVDDTAEAIVLAAEKGRLGEIYFIGGEAVTVGNVMQWFAEQPGHYAVRIFLPVWLAVLLFSPLALLLRMLGLSAFISKETVVSGATNYNGSDAKARRELGWTPKPAHAVWLETLTAERALRGKRKRKDIVSLLKPLDE